MLFRPLAVSNRAVLSLWQPLNIQKTSCYSTETEKKPKDLSIQLLGREYAKDDWTNVTSRIIQHLGTNLHLKPQHPLGILSKIITNHFNSTFRKVSGNPLFTLVDHQSPVVTVTENFDSMLIPQDHVSRRKQDNFYINKNLMLRAHTSAHEVEMIRSGLDAFMIVGDVYRRDTIDTTHYPVFHQVEGVRLFSPHQLTTASDSDEIELFENGDENEMKQFCHTLEASKLTEYQLKETLILLITHLFGSEVEYRWVEGYFPFTHPSFELEIKLNNEWVEMLGCGILRQKILDSAGANQKIGWAFGLGLERLAMKLFNIQDIRYFWSSDQSVLSQFASVDLKSFRNFKFTPPVAKQPLITNDIAFWINDSFDSSDFYDVIRSIGSEFVETVQLVDVYQHPKKLMTSHCYRICYRHVSRPLNRDEVAEIDEKIKSTLLNRFDITPRWQ